MKKKNVIKVLMLVIPVWWAGISCTKLDTKYMTRWKLFGKHLTR
jgi:hypothetical protein